MKSSFGGASAQPEPDGEAPEPVTDPLPQPAPREAPGPVQAEPEAEPVAEPKAEVAPGPSAFLHGLAELIRSRGLEVPDGLLEAPPAAYAGQGEGTVTAMSRLRDADLLERAGKVAGWQLRQVERAEQAWERSPLIHELRRRGLAEPERPGKVVGAAFSLKKPLAQWSDDEVLSAVDQWIELARTTTRG